MAWLTISFSMWQCGGHGDAGCLVRLEDKQGLVSAMVESLRASTGRIAEGKG